MVVLERDSHSHQVDLHNSTSARRRIAYLNWTELHINLAPQWINQLINGSQNIGRVALVNAAVKLLHALCVKE